MSIIKQHINNRHLVITRIFDAPREEVFKAWIDPIQMAKWWGPKAFTNPVCELDARAGGKIHIDMQAPDSHINPMVGKFHEIDEPNRLVFTTTAFKDENGEPQIENLNTITFEDFEGKTKLTLDVKVLKVSPAIEPALSGMETDWKQSFDKLAYIICN